ncbi:hypothetical protein A4A49_01646 [Nicotiana attenuata]|uniref:Retrotransposon gag domain-containing protein n=1 Tax=Nicotiana attenuata TaxID=49451 RepID=A0A1J6I040_NICAT|nr:hypothetical protein A4A49_01646 [Nicotiana attenuata]
MDEIRKLLVGNLAITGVQNHEFPVENERPEVVGHRPRGPQPPTRNYHTEFPVFDGVGLKDWLYKFEQIFAYEEIPEDSKVRAVSCRLEGRALQWHQSYMKHRVTRDWPRWGEYVACLYARFGYELFDDPMGDLKDLRQVSSVQDYVDLFDEMLTRVELSEEYVVSCFIRVHAMNGLRDIRTMRVTVSVKGKAVQVLIDTGSTHNFLDLNTAKKLGCVLTAIAPFDVSVADGKKVKSNYICKKLMWKMKGVSFDSDMLVLPIGGCSMVLGIQWLITLGDIMWNFKNLRMEFNIIGHKVS